MEEGNNVKIYFKNSLVVDGLVQSIEGEEVILLSDHNEVIVIPNKTDSIIFYIIKNNDNKHHQQHTPQVKVNAVANNSTTTKTVKKVQQPAVNNNNNTTQQNTVIKAKEINNPVNQLTNQSIPTLNAMLKKVEQEEIDNKVITHSPSSSNIQQQQTQYVSEGQNLFNLLKKK